MGGGNLQRFIKEKKYGDLERTKETIRNRECLELESVKSGSTLVSFSDGDFVVVLSLQNTS